MTNSIVHSENTTQVTPVTHIKFKKHDVIEYKVNNDDNWSRAVILSRGGKANGIHKNCYNIEKDNKPVGSIELDNLAAYRKVNLSHNIPLADTHTRPYSDIQGSDVESQELPESIGSDGESDADDGDSLEILDTVDHNEANIVYSINDQNQQSVLMNVSHSDTMHAVNCKVFNTECNTIDCEIYYVTN